MDSLQVRVNIAASLTNNLRNWIPRSLTPILSSTLETFSSVLLLGPRQSGKSSLLRHQLPYALHFNLDQVSVRERLETNLALLSSSQMFIPGIPILENDL